MRIQNLFKVINRSISFYVLLNEYDIILKEELDDISDGLYYDHYCDVMSILLTNGKAIVQVDCSSGELEDIIEDYELITNMEMLEIYQSIKMY